MRVIFVFLLGGLYFSMKMSRNDILFIFYSEQIRVVADKMSMFVVYN